MWHQITFNVPYELVDAVVGELAEDGVAGVWEDDSAEDGSACVHLYFPPQSDLNRIEERLRTLFSRSDRELQTITRSVVEECDWNEEWKKSYTAFPVGDDFFVIPSWIDTPCPDDRLPIRIDPGQAFGTGTHETTQLTIEALERWVERHHVVLDVGTGSGILALASRLLGAKEVIACDIDPTAVNVVRANVELNHEPDIWTFCGSVDAVGKGKVHVLLGNLTADLIGELFAEFNRILRDKGIAIFSGILNHQREDMINVCRSFGFTIHEEIARGEWLAIVAEKHGA
jgi:ribosomal protein L11 methyltransferase